jgi:hypothetical protein
MILVNKLIISVRAIEPAFSLQLQGIRISNYCAAPGQLVIIAMAAIAPDYIHKVRIGAQVGKIRISGIFLICTATERSASRNDKQSHHYSNQQPTGSQS